MRRGQVNVGGVEELSSAALQALDAIVAATAEATAHAQRIAAAAGEQDKAFGRLRERIHAVARTDRKSTRLNSSHITISYAVFCLKKKKKKKSTSTTTSATAKTRAII